MTSRDCFHVFCVLEPWVQRQDMPEQEIQMKADIPRLGLEGGRISPAMGSAIQRARGGGQPLERGLQERMSASLGHDFSDVRVHTGSDADELNRQLGADAFTVGSDIFFAQGVYDPDTRQGCELITHELVHVVQQSTGRVSRGRSGLTVRSADDAFEQEAGRLSLWLNSNRGAKTRPTVQPARVEHFAVQRALARRCGLLPALGGPVFCTTAVAYWIAWEVKAASVHGAAPAAPTLNEYSLIVAGDPTAVPNPHTALLRLVPHGHNVTKRSAQVAQGSVLLWVQGGNTIRHAALMGVQGGVSGLYGYNQANWFTDACSVPAGCAANQRCVHTWAGIRWRWHGFTAWNGNHDCTVKAVSEADALEYIIPR